MYLQETCQSSITGSRSSSLSCQESESFTCCWAYICFSQVSKFPADEIIPLNPCPRDLCYCLACLVMGRFILIEDIQNSYLWCFSHNFTVSLLMILTWQTVLDLLHKILLTKIERLSLRDDISESLGTWLDAVVGKGRLDTKRLNMWSRCFWWSDRMSVTPTETSTISSMDWNCWLFSILI